MKENEILRAVLKDTGTRLVGGGYDEADISHVRFFAEAASVFHPGGRIRRNEKSDPGGLCRNIRTGELPVAECAYAQTRHSLIASDGRRLWLQWKVLGRETTPDGRDVMTGYVQQIEFEPPSENGRDRVRIDNLLYRLNSISHTLLALLHSGRTRDTVNKILYEVLTMFRGDRAYIIEFDWEQRTHNCTYEVTAAGVSCEQERLSSLSMEDFPWWTERVTKGPFHHSFRHPRSASRGGGRTRPADGAEDQIAAYHATGLAGQGLGLCRHRHR